jgi:hypothetical protein
MGTRTSAAKAFVLAPWRSKTEESLASNHAFVPVGANARKFVETLQDQISILKEIALCNACRRIALTPERKIARRTVLFDWRRIRRDSVFTFTGLG